MIINWISVFLLLSEAFEHKENEALWVSAKDLGVLGNFLCFDFVVFCVVYWFTLYCKYFSSFLMNSMGTTVSPQINPAMDFGQRISNTQQLSLNRHVFYPIHRSFIFFIPVSSWAAVLYIYISENTLFLIWDSCGYMSFFMHGWNFSPEVSQCPVKPYSK